MALTINPDTSAFGRRLTALMNERNVDDHLLAAMTELAYSTIRSIRRLPKVNPTADTIAKLAKALKTTPDQLHVGEHTDAEIEATGGSGNGQVDAERVLAAIRELEKLPAVAAYRDLVSSLGA
jgi:transcriptional regulator with XRE-family HTH domain